MPFLFTWATAPKKVCTSLFCWWYCSLFIVVSWSSTTANHNTFPQFHFVMKNRKKLGLWVHGMLWEKALPCILHMQICQAETILFYSCWLFWCHYKSTTKSTAMTSELITAQQFNTWSLIAFETLSFSPLSLALSLSRSLYLQRWVTQQQVLGEPWRVLSFCHLYDKLPRQWTWRAGTIIQFQLLTLGIRLHAFATASGKKKEIPLSAKKRSSERSQTKWKVIFIIWPKIAADELP